MQPGYVYSQAFPQVAYQALSKPALATAVSEVLRPQQCNYVA
jgi:hypothetical protein